MKKNKKAVNDKPQTQTAALLIDYIFKNEHK